jgi:beta-xylosidase
MKKYGLLLLVAVFTAAVEGAEVVDFTFEGNPLVRHIYTADPSARVFDGTLYLYTSHDQDNSKGDKHFDMLDWRVFSTKDMTNWTDHGSFFGLEDIDWAVKQAWAPDCVKRNGKYFFYYPVEQAKIGVAVSDNPVSGFKDPLGKPLVDKAWNPEVVGQEPIDPAILIDDDGQAYMFFGCRDARYVKLKENMIELDGEIQPVVIKDIEKYKKKSIGGWYGEGPWIFKRNGIYYLLYSNGWGKTATIVYATSDKVEGPWEYQGETMAPMMAGTSHGSITEYKGKWYIFYHDKSLSGDKKRRSVCFDEISFSPDGKIIRLDPGRN